jgi:hypothetical protein
MRYETILVALVMIILSGCTQNSTPDMIGGQRDEHGCLGPAGYSWNQTIGACVREWELDESQRKAAEIAVDEAGYAKGTTIIEVETLRCPGCFNVKLEKGMTSGENIVNVNIVNWEASVAEENPDIAACPADAKLCPDGSAVGRTGPNCEFAPCPEETCKDMCGDGECQEIVCLAIGCPCSETAETCPSDCG